MDLSEKAWDNRYLNNDIGWDLGTVSPPLKAYFDQLENKELKILIPGGGNAHEAEYLFNSGFVNVFVVDLSKTAIDNIKKRIPEFPSSHLILGDFFEVDDAFDLIIEQTFFCALNPNLRENYAQKMHQLLKVKGTLWDCFLVFLCIQIDLHLAVIRKNICLIFNLILRSMIWLLVTIRIQKEMEKNSSLN